MMMMLVKAHNLPHLHPLGSQQCSSKYPVANCKPLTLYETAISLSPPLYRMMRQSTSVDEKDFSVEVEGFWPVMESLFSTSVVDLFYDGLVLF